MFDIKFYSIFRPSMYIFECAHNNTEYYYLLVSLGLGIYNI